jgi:hypothetical protein
MVFSTSCSIFPIEEPLAPPKVTFQLSAPVEEDKSPPGTFVSPPPGFDWKEKRPQASVLGKCQRELALTRETMGFPVMPNAQGTMTSGPLDYNTFKEIRKSV